MIHKSYIVEEDINVLKNNLILIYGENTGLIDELKNKIIIQDKKNQIIRLTQEEVLKNENILFNEINNISLFGGEKTIFINMLIPMTCQFTSSIALYIILLYTK